MRTCPICRVPGEPYGPVYQRCSGCGLIFYPAVPTPSELEAVYGGSPAKRWRRRLLRPFRRMWMLTRLAEKRARASRILDAVAGYGVGSATRFMDVGCNKGFLLEGAEARGWKAWGVEYELDQVAALLNSYPALAERVRVGPFPEVTRDLPGDLVDLVTAIDVMEHVLDPLESFREVRRLLAPDGVLCIQTPDSASPEARREGSSWYEMKPKEHVQLFDLSTLRRVAEATGFASVEQLPSAFEPGVGNGVFVLRGRR